MKINNLILSICNGLLPILSVLFYSCTSSPLEVLVASQLTISPQWQELRSPSEMKTSGEWSELLIEIPDLSLGIGNGQNFLVDGAELKVDCYLTSKVGEKVSLTKTSFVGYGNERFLKLSNSVLEWKKRNYLFQSVTLRSNRRLKVGRIIWLSYDPQSFKDGTAFPKSRKRQ